jgi:hypothetical protein
MRTETAKGPRRDRVTQFSVFTPNRLGRLAELINRLSAKDVHVLALTVLDTTDSAIIRLIVDDPESARELLTQGEFPFSETSLMVVEANPSDLARLMAALLEVEININYLYPFIPHPEGFSRIAMSVEDNELAEQALQRQNFKTLRQADISR